MNEKKKKKNKETNKQNNLMFKDPLSLYYIWKIFIDIPFVKTVRRTSF